MEAMDEKATTSPSRPCSDRVLVYGCAPQNSRSRFYGHFLPPKGPYQRTPLQKMSVPHGEQKLRGCISQRGASVTHPLLLRKSDSDKICCSPAQKSVYFVWRYGFITLLFKHSNSWTQGMHSVRNNNSSSSSSHFYTNIGNETTCFVEAMTLRAAALKRYTGHRNQQSSLSSVSTATSCTLHDGSRRMTLCRTAVFGFRV